MGTTGEVRDAGKEQVMESGHQDVVHDVSVDYYGKRLASCSSDRLIKVFAISSEDVLPNSLATLAGHEGPVWQVAWAHPKFGSILASCSYDRKVIIWREGAENEWHQDQVFQEHESSVNSISWSPHEFGLGLACGSSDGTISVLTLKPDGSWEKAKIQQAHPVGVTSVSWASASSLETSIGADSRLLQRLASGGCDNTVKVWKFENNSWKLDCFPPLSKHVDWVRDVGWAPNFGLGRSTIASASQDGTVVIWTQKNDGDQWQSLTLNDFKTPVWRVSWSLTGNILAVSDSSSKVTLWKEEVDGDWVQISNAQ
ncbi:protein transport protein SEC13 homolog B [Physcomitrium patens]|uniref:Uncharacterized protein n=2 Tax=Physcomitrium patens TaxID=3218 RepID=A0A2K1IP36_PHYPA|nr:protein transport protein SEC13 homolog B-like [Physcomitrium patens]PNR31043.1 hypothetical protein PHYPA_027359 [Physcomitrium patens]|eukprot:XP_024360104.1 protein transport protein SEC13 homolog B-like [Physcomitrella patens]